MERRLPPRETEWIDRNQRVEFRFEGRTYHGYAGDVLSSALWANDVRMLGRSFKYHRPRGIYSLAGHDANVMVEDDRRTNLRGDLLAIAPGLDVRAVNTAGGLERDRLRITERFSSFLPVGFYYKAFHTPRRLFPFYENQMRKVAGLGRINSANEFTASPKDYAFCDLLVVGSGPAGLAGAVAAAEQGLNVLLVDEQPRPGGSFAWQWAGDASARKRFNDLIEQIGNLDNLHVRCGTQAAGWYADHWIALVDDRRLTKLRAKAMLVAAGCFEQPAVFQNNDLPGVMLGSAAQRLIHQYAVKPFDQVVVLTANADGYRVALNLHEAGVEVKAVIDLRSGSEPSELGRRVAGEKIAIQNGRTVYEAVPAAGKTRIRGAVICPLDDDGNPQTDAKTRLDCDGIAVSVGWAPNAGLVYQAGGRFSYAGHVEQFVPTALPPGVFVAGRANGIFDLEAQMADGRRAGLAAAAHLGRYEGAIADSPEHCGEPPSHPYPIFAHKGKKNFVDLDEDLHLTDFINAHQEGYDNIELLKRYTTVGMGPSQGKLSNVNAVRILARLNGASIDETGTTTSRPFHQPVPLGHLAGRRFHPLRRTPIHDWHEQAGAEMVNAGAWLRPEFYKADGKCREDCILDEALAVRQNVGLIDVGTLGKIHIHGPDAVRFLEHIYTGRFAKQPTGRLRYGLACDETGIIIEDGVVARLAENRFYVTATSSGAAAFYREMLRWALIFGMDVLLVNATGQLAAMNIAGPNSRQVLEGLTDIDLSSEAFPYLGVREGTVAGVQAILMRVGFVGELGYEIHVPASHGHHVWTSLMRAGEHIGIRPFGVEAQRLLRLEKGHLIVGQDTDALTNPYEADVAWAIGKNKPFFAGARSLEIAQKKPLTRRLVGLDFGIAPSGSLPDECHLIVAGGEIAGRITSIAHRSTLGRPIALAFVRPDLAEMGTLVSVRVDNGSLVQAEVVKIPFYDPEDLRQEVSEEQERRAGSAEREQEQEQEQKWRAGSISDRRIYGAGADADAEAGVASRERKRLELQSDRIERTTAQTLGLCDLGGLPKFGVNGRDAQSWLVEQEVDVPAEIYDSRSLAGGGLIVRLGINEFLLESAVANDSVGPLRDRLSSYGGNAFRVERQEATFLLVGARAPEVLAQTCSIDFREAPPRRLLLTRMAGVNCGVFPDLLENKPMYRLWVDCTYAISLWEALLEICDELGGRAIGAGGLYPESL